jgi:hypothetical protein
MAVASSADKCTKCLVCGNRPFLTIAFTKYQIGKNLSFYLNLG